MIGKLRRIAALTIQEGPLRASSSATAHRVHEHLQLLRAGWRPRGDRVVRGAVSLPLDPQWAIARWLEPLGAAGCTFANSGPDEFIVEAPDGTRFITAQTGLVDLLAAIEERYVQREYAQLDVAGAVVVDVGAYVGDSALYFARAGALEVYAYEPFEATYRAALRNLELNAALAKRIVLRHAGVGAGAATASGMLDAGTPMLSTIVPTAGAVGTAESVQLVGLAGVVAEARSAHPQARLVCKLDCEGAEFEILTSAPVEALREVDQLIVEYHYRDPEPILEVLRAAGLSVSELPERHRVERDGEVGMLLAVR